MNSEYILVMKPKPTAILWELISRLANCTLTIRISGESGTGKKSIVQLLSRHYPHKNSVFIEFDCKALKLQCRAPAKQTPISGSVEAFLRVLAEPQYHILYLDHVESLPEELQARLLALFENHHHPASPWIISSSVEPLEQFVQQSSFNHALLKALDTVHIALPPLRDTPDRIPQMIAWLMRQDEVQPPCGRRSIPDMDTMENLIHYHWPGNWRQLQRATRTAFNANEWNLAFETFEFDKDLDENQINHLAAIYILSLAKLTIQKERVMEGLMTSSNLDEIGLLDLAIFHEAVSQIADHICTHNPNQENN
jgi:two-component system response regulator HydG